MPQRKKIFVPALLLAAALLASACGGGDKAPEPQTVSAPTARVALFDARECRSLPGEVRSQNSVVLSSKISGTVVEVMAAEGAVVEKGQPILRIDDTELKQRVQAVQSTAQQAGLERQALTARSALAKVNLERMQKLFAQQAISQDELDRARTEHQALKKQEQALAASAASAGHMGAEAKSLLGYSLITAPFRGVLSRRFVDQGAFVNAGAPLASVDEMAPGGDAQGGYEIEAQADESMLPMVSVGMQVLGLVPSLSHAPFVTRLTTVVGRVDPATRTFKLRADYKAPAPAPADTPQDNATQADATQDSGRNIRPRAGMFGKVCVPVARAKKLLVPAGVIRQQGELTTALVVDEKGVLRLRLVKLGGAYLKAELDGQSYIVQAQTEALPESGSQANAADVSGTMVEVLSGLVEGETVVVGGPATLREGDRLAAKR
ncbi:MAG: efflux RND transporter periplasmic adaptor subunit [Humidesulfovibrio sp.]|uniref:efflux RND transporter periplasmic adaptor subunit n=1 Tax=Humidesulfovibrio sp. TaxID=2910988 RepID=UPI0027EE3A31|nr:efflux RND transporter periplasmic adaptor subunit [Humidesulfovibrio sp.]MDQ7834928.1 efflux RND transporter periplasmic adaptor subunit [Humidesulfovibrio sp.]